MITLNSIDNPELWVKAHAYAIMDFDYSKMSDRDLLYSDWAEQLLMLSLAVGQDPAYDFLSDLEKEAIQAKLVDVQERQSRASRIESDEQAATDYYRAAYAGHRRLTIFKSGAVRLPDGYADDSAEGRKSAGFRSIESIDSIML